MLWFDCVIMSCVRGTRCAVRSFSCEKLGGYGEEPFSMSTMDITLKGILPLTALAEPAVG